MKLTFPFLTDVPGLSCPTRVEQFRSEVSAALLDYCNMANIDSEMTSDKFGQLLLQLSEIKLTSLHLESYLYDQHLAGNTTDSNLLVEILHSCRQWFCACKNHWFKLLLTVLAGKVSFVPFVFQLFTVTTVGPWCFSTAVMFCFVAIQAFASSHPGGRLQ